MPSIFSADHIAAQGGGFEPVRKNNFTVEFNIGGQLIQHALDSFPFPKSKNSPVIAHYGNEERKVAGVAVYEDQNLTLKDFVDEKVARLVWQWRKMVYDPETGAIGRAAAYKTTGTLTLRDPSGSGVAHKWLLIGAWPSADNYGDGDMGANDINKIQVTITIDKVRQL